ncbi:MAG TPA: BCCT family transporter [Woeseiaceae bacterium]|nr:BCCT family transporter [Woeseiaceae bacterium]
MNKETFVVQERRRTKLTLHPWVFGISAGLILLFIVLTLANLDAAEATFNTLKNGITRRFGWFLILTVQGFLLFCVYLAVSRFGHIRIGGPGARPEFSSLSWFAMLFAAGMGIGLMFWSVAEPILHLRNPPGAAPMTAEGAQRAMDLTFLHWGFHVWGIYALVGLALAYFSYNRGLPLTIRSAFYPLIGRRIDGPLGNVIDALAVIATLFGLATSLGLGVAQINAGLDSVFGMRFTIGAQIILIAVITALATGSVVSGIDRGIRLLSLTNLYAALLLLVFVLLVGPTLFLFKNLVQSTGHYLQNLLTLGSWAETYARDESWQSSWTLFYWAWWIAWSPFVGMFIARISRGRTVREFIFGVLLVPSLLTFIWVSVFGGAAIYEALFVDTAIVDAANQNVATALFELLTAFPLADVTVLLAVFLVAIFFVTSCDSGSLVMDILTSGGYLHSPVVQRAFWAILSGVVAAVLMLGGGLTALQTASITSGLPFAVVLVLMAWGLLKAFREDMPAMSHRAAVAMHRREDGDDE